MKRAGTAVLVAGMAVAGLAGCESGQTTSQGATTTAAPALWNPCTEIPDEVLRAAGVDPGTEESGVAGVPQSGWEICGWSGPQYSLTVYTTAKTVEYFEQRPGNINFANVTIAGRAGRQFKVQGDSRNLICDVVFSTGQGVVQLGVVNSAIIDGPLPDPCENLQTAGAVMVPTFPK
ncbi:DUF3558 domain-containing protein [Nocardia neocaledoniensis]|uniref:DUF3558 domain-containing protein n=1 Tax=Nocardia neocaledoniensis TaxID=236511 RepID=UPI00340A6672